MKGNLQERKQKHLDICLDRSLSIESGDTGFTGIKIAHRSMPEIDSGTISLRTPFIGYQLKMPVMISCMTGGSKEGEKLNRMLAEIAEDTGLAFGTGSIRVMLRHPETSSHFKLKKLAPDVPVLANIGAAQLIEYPPETLIEAVKSIDADGLYVHLNPAQELFQDGGERIFKGWYEGLNRLLDHAKFPVLVKETGNGIPPAEGLRMLEREVSFIDVAGAGGTDWIAVEAHSKGGGDNSAAASYTDWGYSTGELLLAYRQIVRAGGDSGSLVSGKIIASGGLRTPRDFAVSLACGAYLAAAALPFIRLASEGGPDAVAEYIAELEIGIRAAITLSGSGSLENLRKTELRVNSDLAFQAEALAEEALKEVGNNGYESMKR